MPSATLASRLIGAADVLLRDGPRSSAFRRRAVSTAYCAVFHRLAKICAESLLPDIERGEEEYARLYRALDHGPMKNAFGQPPLSEHEHLRQIGRVVVRLQSERHRADYAPPNSNLFPREEAAELVALARQTILDLNALGTQECRTLAVCLLFKVRPS